MKLKLPILFVIVFWGFNCNNLLAQDREPGINTIYPEPVYYHNGGRVIDVTKEPFNAKGDGITDDTEAINAAYSFVGEQLQENSWRDGNKSSYILYFPSGTYLVSNTLIHNLGQIFYPGNGREDTEGITWVRFVGQNRENTIIKLQDNSPGFEVGADKEVISFQLENVGDREGNNIPAASQLSNLTIDTGSGNPGAIGASFISANTGQISNITIRSGDGQGAVGLSLPFFSVQGYYRDITIEGFDYGIRALRGEVNPAFEYVTLRNQNICGIFANDGSVNIRKTESFNSVPFAIIDQDEAHVIILESILSGGDASTPAIDLQNSESQLFVRNTTIQGYETSIRKDGEDLLSGNIEEYVSDEVYTLFEGFPKRTLGLPVADSPIIPWEQDLTNWANVDEFPGETDLEKIQNAMNSGKSTIYFPKAQYYGTGQITIPATVKHVDFLYSRVSNNVEFVISEASSDVLFLEHTNLNRSTLVQTQPRPTVIRNASFDSYNYTSSQPSELYLEGSGSFGDTENFCPPSMNIWGRSINNEIKSTSCFKVRGSLWTIGYKTEGDQASFEVKEGGSAEVFGGLRNETTKSPENPLLINNNSNASFIGYNFLSGGGNPIITDIQDGIEQELLRSELPVRGGSSVYVPLYVGTTDATAPACFPPYELSAKTGLDSVYLTWKGRNTTIESYELRFKATGTEIWTTLTDLPETYVALEGLIQGKTYEWQVRGNCSETEVSEYSSLSTFTVALGVGRTTETINIDGNPDEADWLLDIAANKEVNGTVNNDVHFGLLWDREYLYVAAEVMDESLINDSDQPFRDDAVEIYIDVNNNGGSYDSFDNQFIVGYGRNSILISKPFEGEVLHSLAEIDGGYTVELAIPWSGLGLLPGNNVSIGFDIGVDDDDDGEARDGQQVWAGTNFNFNNTDGFGDIILQGGVETEAKLELHYTWDSKVEDEVNGHRSSLSDFVNFNQDAVLGSSALDLLGTKDAPAEEASVNIANGSLLNQSFNTRSYSLWFKPRDTDSRQILFEEGGDGSGVAFELVNNELSVIFRYGAGDGYGSFSVPFPSEEEPDWTHIAVTFEAGIIGVYINGELRGASSIPAQTIPAHANPPSLGGVSENQSPTNEDSYYYNGLLDEFKVFSGVLNAEQIEGLAYRPVRIPAAQLSLYYTWDNKFSDEVNGQGSSFNDYSSFTENSPFGTHSAEINGNSAAAESSAISIQNGSLLNQGFSFRSYSIWVKANDSNSRQLLFEEGGDLGGAGFELSEGNLEILFRHGGGGNFTTLTVPFPDNGGWNHLAVIYSAGEITAWINGEQAGTVSSVVGTIPNHNNPPSLGGNRNTQSPTNNDVVFFDGLMDEFKVFDGVLREKEIIDLASGLAKSNGDVLHWSLDESQGDFVYNIAGPGRIGEIIEGTASELTTEGIINNGFKFQPESAGDGPVVFLEQQLISAYPLSFSTWVNTNQTQLSQLYTLADNSSNRMHISLGIVSFDKEDGSKGVQPYILADDNVGPAKRVDSNYDINGGWHLINMVLESATSRKLYVDGVLVAEDQRSLEAFTFNNQQLSFGGSIRGTFNGNRYKGKADEFKFFSKVLMPEDIEDMRVSPIFLEVPSSIELEIDTTTTINATLNPIFSVQGLAFESSAPEIISVDENGKLSPHLLGEVEITVSSIANPALTETIQVSVVKTMGDCKIEASSFPTGAKIVDMETTAYADFDSKKESEVIGIATGFRPDGRAGVWEIQYDCSVQPVQRSGNMNLTTLLPDIFGIEREYGWKYIPQYISEDGQYIYGYAENENGFTNKFGWTIEAGTALEIRFKMGSPFKGKIRGVEGEITCTNLIYESYDEKIFVIDCGEGDTSDNNVSVLEEWDILYAPNPVQDRVKFIIPSREIRKGVSVSIHDYSGTILIQERLNDNMEMDLSKLQKGVYIAIIDLGDGVEKIFRIKLIKE